MIKVNILKRICLIAFLLIFTLLALSGCNRKPSDFTEEEHIQRVTERIKAKYVDGDEKLRPYDKPVDDGIIYDKVKATDFDVFPLYDENDTLKYFLVEFEPYGFIYVFLRDEQPKVFSCIGTSTGMYVLSSREGEPLWSRYKIDETNNQSPPDTDIQWEVDECGERIFYDASPYSIANVGEEKRYLLCADSVYYIPAVKKNGQYLNLLSMELIDDNMPTKQATAHITFPNRKHFDL